MTQLKQVIQAIKDIDFKTLENLLDDHRSFMDVSKRLFLETLKEEIQFYIIQGLDTYQEFLIGTCDNCCDNCKAYSFYAEGFPYLNLCISEIDGKVNDIKLCHNIIGIDRDVNSNTIFFRFFEEDKIDFKPNLEYLIDKQRVEKAVEDFKETTNQGLINIGDLIYWRNKHEDIMDAFGFNAFFLPKQYKAFEEFDNLMFEVNSFIDKCDDNDYALKAIDHYNNIKNSTEKELVKWIFKHEQETFYFDFDQSKHWQKTGIMRLSEDHEVMIDCSDCINVFKLSNIYYKEEARLMNKYEPTKEHYKQHKNGLICTLEIFLRLHGKYLDILPKEH